MNRMKKLTASVAVLSTLCSTAIVFSMTIPICEGFVIQHQTKNSFNSRLQMTSLESSMTILTLTSPILSTALSTASVEAPSIASELMDDALHVGDILNLPTFSEMPLAIPVLSVASRLLYMVSDYLPDHNILPSEFIYHSIMLVATSASIFKTFKDILYTRDQKLTIQDQRCFISLFRPAGLNWVQFKQLRKESVIQWLDVAPGKTIASSESMQSTCQEQEDFFWLQNGSVELQSNDHTIQTVIPKSSQLFGNLRCAVSLSTKRNESLPRMTIKAGSEGAKVLRIDSLRLRKLMETDESVNVAVRNMVLEGMQENVASLLSPAKNNLRNQNITTKA